MFLSVVVSGEQLIIYPTVPNIAKTEDTKMVIAVALEMSIAGVRRESESVLFRREPTSRNFKKTAWLPNDNYLQIIIIINSPFMV